MRKIIVVSFITLDGVIQAPGGPTEDTSGGFKYGGWTVPYFDESLEEIMDKQMNKQSDLLLGRKTFEIFAGYWPQHETGWPGINEKTKFVVSRSFSTHEWNNSVFLNDDIVNQIKKLKTQDGPDLQVYGSGNLIQTLLRNNLIDELWLKIFPLTLGNGKKLFAEGTIPMNFKLLKSNVTPHGVINASYVRDGDVKTGSFED
jgi:dihydrofolate reductase